MQHITNSSQDGQVPAGHNSEPKTQHHSSMPHHSEPSAPRRVSMVAKVAIGIIVFVALAWVLSALRAKSPSETPVVDEETATSTPPVTYAAFIPVTDGAKVYTLEGVEFVFEPQVIDEQGMPSTRIRLQLNGFKRNGVPIEVARYRLGTYRGECAQIDPETYANSSAERDALGFAACNYEGVGRQLAVFQEGKELVVKVRSVTEDASAEPMFAITRIDVTAIVQ
jgi:hypothetical protein